MGVSEYAVPGLAGTTVLVTGGASGMGLSTVLLAAHSGARVVVGDMNEALLTELEQRAEKEELNVRCVRLDVSDSASVAAFLAEADADPAMPLKGVVCSAGIAPESPFLEMSLEQWNQVLAVNLTGAFLVTQGAAKIMVERGLGGSIVNVSAGNAVTGSVNRAHYTASKAGMISLTKTMARELGVFGIRVNSIAPGAVNTPLARSLVSLEESAKRAAAYPIPRVGEPEDLAHAIGFFLSDLSPWITGQVVHVSGGMIMQ